MNKLAIFIQNSMCSTSFSHTRDLVSTTDINIKKQNAANLSQTSPPEPRITLQIFKTLKIQTENL